MKTFRYLLLFLFLVSLAGFRTQASDFSDIQVHTLDNGLKIYTREVRVAPVVSVNVFYRVASRNEATGITGISHLLEHMMFKGSRNFPRGVFEQKIRERGGIQNAGTWTDFTYYWQLIQSDYLEMCLEMEADRMNGALFNAEDLVSEMPVVRSELEGRENSPDSRLWDIVNATAFTAHPYQWPIIGWRSDVEGITRDEIYEYYRRYYGPNNAAVVLVGDFDTQEAVALVEKHFGHLEPIPDPPGVRTVEPEQRGERTAMLKLAGTSERVLMAWPNPDGFSDDHYALDVLEQILSGGRASRLHQALVETGLATSAWAFNSTRTDPSLFYAGATAQQGRTANELRETLLEQIEKIKETPPSQEELARAKRQIEAAFVFNNDDVRNQAVLFGRAIMTTGLDRLKSYLPGIRAVTAEQVSEAARRFLVEDRRTVGKFIPTGEEPSPAARGGNPAGPAHFRPDDSGLPEVNPLYESPQGDNPEAGRGIPEPVRFELENGIVLIVLSNHANPSISISGMLEAGSWLETEDKRGLSSFTARLLERGSAGLSSLEFATAIEEMGATLSFASGLESTDIAGQCLSEDFPRLTELLAGALRQPVFGQEDIERVRREMLSALAQSEERPSSVATRALYNSLYPQGHPLHPGSREAEEEAYRSITGEDIREFHRQYYGPRGMILVVVGDITPQKAKEQVEKYFSDWEAQPGYRPLDIPEVPLASSREEKVVMADKSEVTVMMGWPTRLKRSSEEYYAAIIMNEILGGGSVLTSRLGKSIRGEKGLVYDVRSYFASGKTPGPFIASLGTNPKNAGKATEELKRLVEEMQAEGPAEEEVAASRQFISGVLSLRLATNAGIAGFLRSAEFFGLGMDYLRDFRTLYGQVTRDQAAAAARELLKPDQAVIVTAGAEIPTDDGEPENGE